MTRTLHLVSHTHWDREWYLTFQQFRLKLVHLIDNLLALLEADPQYKYFMLDGQTILLEDYVEVRPERAATLRGHVEEGRLLIGPWHILPDEFLVSPEATIRNLLQGERTSRDFGPKLGLGYLPDMFGHIGQMPQILRGFGLGQAVVRRGLSDEPCELWWEAPDGSRVFAAYMRDGYDNAAHLPISDPPRFVSEVRRLCNSLAPHAAVPHILLMQGTDHMEPSPDTPAALAFSQGRLEGDELIHSTLPVYVAAAQAAVEEGGITLPTVRGELRSPKRHHLLPGVYSARMWIKQRNHACETLLVRWAEPFSTWASQVEGEQHGGSLSHRKTGRVRHPAPIIRRAWWKLMECHPHDSICGCSVDQVHAEMRCRFDGVEQLGEEITNQSLAVLAAAVDTGSPPGDARAAIVVFNPVAGPRTDLVTVEVERPGGLEAFEIVDGRGAVMPHRLEDAAGAGDRSSKTMLVSFVAREVPGHGYRAFWLRPGAGRSDKAPPAPLTIENEFLSVEASPADGSLTVTDKRTGVVYCGLNRFVDGGDCGDEYNYCPPPTDRLLSLPRVDGVRRDVDRVGQSLELTLTLSVPTALTADRQRRSGEAVPLSITTQATLVPGVPRLDIQTWVDNPARDHRLRVHFPAPVSVAAADHDGHFEVVRRPIGRPAYDDSWVEEPRPECPQRAFTDVSDGRVGLMVANRGLPEVEALVGADGTEIALTLLRCVGWLSRDDFPARRGHAGPMLPTPDAQMIGRWSFDYAVIPHEGDWREAFGQAYAFNAPMRAMAASLHPGVLPTEASFVRMSPEAFVVSAVKAAEDGAGWIVHGYNVGPEPIAVTLTPWKPFANAERVTLAEQSEAPLLPAADGGVTLPVRGHEIATVRFSP